jgi:predicted nucleic acid-binding protein
VRVLLDSNLLLLWIVGLADPKFIESNKRLKAYSAGDFELLTEQISGATELVVTPYNLAEVSNLLDLKPSRDKQPLADQFKRVVCSNRTVEIHQNTSEVTQSSHFQRLGLTDCAIAALDPDIVVYTADLDLYLHLCGLGRQENAVNFSCLRDSD